ncbi:hypothetical protein RYX36_033812 [Vicia faba]
MKESIGMFQYKLVVTVIVVLALSYSASSEQLSSRECENLNFTILALCSDCNTQSKYVKDKGQKSISDFSHTL